MLRSKRKRNSRLNFHRPWAVSVDRAGIPPFFRSDCRRVRSTSIRVIIKWLNRRQAAAWPNRSLQTNKFQPGKRFRLQSPFLSEKRRSSRIATSSRRQVNSSSSTLSPHQRDTLTPIVTHNKITNCTSKQVATKRA